MKLANLKGIFLFFIHLHKIRLSFTDILASVFTTKRKQFIMEYTIKLEVSIVMNVEKLAP